MSCKGINSSAEKRKKQRNFRDQNRHWSMPPRSKSAPHPANALVCVSQGKIRGACGVRRGCSTYVQRVVVVFWWFTEGVSCSTLCYQLGNRKYCRQVKLEYFSRTLRHNKIIKNNGCSLFNFD
jgi:hypothetical protein